MVSKSAWFGRAFFLFLGLANLALLASVACSATNDDSWQIEWEKTLTAADKEGEVSFYPLGDYGYVS